MPQNNINFLQIFTKKEPSLGFSDLLLILLVIVFAILLWQFYPLGFVLLVGLLIFLAFVYNPEWGMYALITTGLLIGWEISLSSYQQIREISFISNLNAPVVDFIAFGLLAAITVVYIFNIRGYKLKDVFSKQFGFFAIGLFMISGIVSSILVFEPGGFSGSFYYFLRNIVFVYLAFVVLPVLVIKDRQMLERVLWVLFWVGFAIAAFGAVAFIQQLIQFEIPRVSPFAIYGFAPLKFNHNILAEALVAVVPIAGYLSMHRKEEIEKKWMLAATGFIILITLLTLSRAAWICLILQLVAASCIFRERVKSFFRRKSYLKPILIISIVPMILYMSYFLTTEIVSSSNRWRLEVLQIVSFYFTDNPVFGYGPGTFISILEGVKAYTINFGQPLDAHGFVQKILLEQGLFGLLSFVLFLGWILYKVWKSYRKAHIGRMMLSALFISAFSAIVFQLFNTSYYNSHMWLPIGLALAGVNVFERVKF